MCRWKFSFSKFATKKCKAQENYAEGGTKLEEIFSMKNCSCLSRIRFKWAHGSVVVRLHLFHIFIRVRIQFHFHSRRWCFFFRLSSPPRLSFIWQLCLVCSDSSGSLACNVLLVSSVGLLPPPWVLLNHVRNIFLMMKPPSGWKLHLMNVCLATTSQLRNVLMWRVESCARASLWNIKTFPFKLSDFCNSMNWIYEKANDPQSRLNHIVT